MAKILSAAPVIEAVQEKTRNITKQMSHGGIEPTLAIVRVGEKPDDVSYERGAAQKCEAVGVAVRSVVLEEHITQHVLMDTLDALNQDTGVHGILLLQPLPPHLDGEAARCAILPE